MSYGIINENFKFKTYSYLIKLNINNILNEASKF